MTKAKIFSKASILSTVLLLAHSSTAMANAEQRAQTELPAAESLKNMIIRMDDGKSTVPTASNANDGVGNLREQPLTLQGAVSQAVHLNKTVVSDKNEVERFKWDYYAAQTNRLPNVRAISFLSANSVAKNELVTRSTNAIVILSAMLPVTQQYRLGLEARAIKLASEIARYKLDQEIDDTTAKVKTVYYKVVLDQTKVQTLEVTLKYLRELHSTTANRLKEGNALKVDLMKVQAQLDRSELDLLRARDEMRIDTETLNHLMGENIAARPTLQSIPAAVEIEVNEKMAEEKALAQRPEIRAADAKRLQVNLDKKIFLSHYIPDVSVGASYISLPGFNNSVLPKNGIAPGIFITYNAFDWGHRAFLAKGQSKREQAAVATAANVRDEVLIDLHKQMNKLSEARLAVKTSKFSRDVALEDLRVTMNRYKYTSDKLSEVLLATTELATANDAYQQAMLAFWEAKAQFDRAMGE